MFTAGEKHILFSVPRLSVPRMIVPNPIQGSTALGTVPISRLLVGLGFIITGVFPSQFYGSYWDFKSTRV